MASTFPAATAFSKSRLLTAMSAALMAPLLTHSSRLIVPARCHGGITRE
jgi:hypothetical protein